MLALRRTWLTLVIQCKSQCSRNVYISGVYAEDDKDPLHLPGVLRTITCQDRWNSYWYQLQLRRTSICIAYVFPHSSPSINRTLLPSSIRASTFLRFRSQYYPAKPPFIAAIPATLAPSTTVAREGECYHVLFFIVRHNTRLHSCEPEVVGYCSG